MGFVLSETDYHLLPLQKKKEYWAALPICREAKHVGSGSLPATLADKEDEILRVRSCKSLGRFFCFYVNLLFLFNLRVLMSNLLKLAFIIVSLIATACAPVNQPAKPELSKQAEFHYKSALAHLQGGSASSALRELLQAVKLAPEDSAIQEALARTYQRKKAYSLAEVHYLKSLELSENDPRYLNNLASLYLEMEQWDNAIKYFDLAAKDLLFERPHVAVAGKAYAYLQKNDYPQALIYSTEAADIAPRYARAYFLKSNVYEEMGNDEQQEMYLLRAIREQPQFFSARYKLAVLLTKNNRLEEAKEQLQLILEFYNYL